jgi:hypothetical protein
MIEVLTELGRRMSNYELRITNYDGVAARNIARDMLSRELLTAWLADYPGLPVAKPRNVFIIMAGNIPFVGMHDLVCVLVAGHRAIVKPSSRDRKNMEWVVAQLLAIDPHTPVSIAHGECAPDAVIAMGSDATIAAIAASHARIPTLLRGNRSSLAVLTGRETTAELEGLADDVLMYSGLGCRSVSLVWMPRGYDFGSLVEVLRRREGTLPETWRGSFRQTRALMQMTAAPHIDTGAALLTKSRDFAQSPGTLNYTFYDTPTEITEWLKEHNEQIQCVATNHSSLITDHSRATRLGQAQHPGLTDYPDGCDTMQFLKTI